MYSASCAADVAVGPYVVMASFTRSGKDLLGCMPVLLQGDVSGNSAWRPVAPSAASLVRPT